MADQTAIERVEAYLKQVGTYHLATIDGDQARVRPFGTAHIIDGKLCIQTGRSKDVFKQMMANPKIELEACDGPTWLRVTGTAVEVEGIEVQEAMLEAYPQLRAMYTPGDGNTTVVAIVDATATFSSFTEAPKTIEF